MLQASCSFFDVGGLNCCVLLCMSQCMALYAAKNWVFIVGSRTCTSAPHPCSFHHPPFTSFTCDVQIASSPAISLNAASLGCAVFQRLRPRRHTESFRSSRRKFYKILLDPKTTPNLASKNITWNPNMFKALHIRFAKTSTLEATLHSPPVT